MLKRIFLTAGILLVGYNIWLHFKPIPVGNQVYSYWVKENHVKAQKYLHEAFTPKIVLTGSSLSSVLTPWLPDSIYDFSMVGGSWLTGIEIINRTQKLPNVLGIEINYLLRSEDTYITQDAIESDWKNVRQLLPSFYAFNQPMDILTTSWQKNQMREKIHYPNSSKAIYQLKSKEKLTEFQERPDSILSMEMVDYLKQITSNLNQRGCKVFLYLMPMDTALLQSPKTRAILSYIEKLELPIILPSYHFQWRTTDAEHLSPEHALLYTQYLIKEMNNIPWDNYND